MDFALSFQYPTVVGITSVEPNNPVTFDFRGPELVSFDYAGTTYQLGIPYTATFSQYESFQVSKS